MTLWIAIAGVALYSLLRRFRPAEESMRPPPQQVERTDAEAADDLRVPAVIMRAMFPATVVFAMYLLFRGHNLPGGGFVAGLTLAIAFIIQYMAGGTRWFESRLDVVPLRWTAIGLLVAAGTGLGAWLFAHPFLTAHILHLQVPLLGDLPFRRFWAAQTISFFGDQINWIALPLVAVLALDAGPGQMGLLAAVGTVPNLLFSLHAGALVDRRGRRRETMIWADWGRAALLATVPLAYWLDVLTMAQLYVVAFLTGTLTVAFFVCLNALFTMLVPREDYVAGNSLVNGSRAFSFVAGPSLGGILVQVLSAPAALVGAVAGLREPRTTIGGVNLVVGFRPELWTSVAPDDSPTGVTSFRSPVTGPPV